LDFTGINVKIFKMVFALVIVDATERETEKEKVNVKR
jgi:hypothetical protein